MEPDVTAFAQAVIDPSLSKAELEAKRVTLDTKFTALVQSVLEQSIANEMSQKLVDQLNGDTGDKIVGAYKDPLKRDIGQALCARSAKASSRKSRMRSSNWPR